MRVQQPNVCTNIFSYVNLRQETTSTRISDDFKSNFSALHLPEAIRENELAFGEYDKIFAAEWLNEDHIICGTKCNNVSCNLFFVSTIKFRSFALKIVVKDEMK